MASWDIESTPLCMVIQKFKCSFFLASLGWKSAFDQQFFPQIKKHSRRIFDSFLDFFPILWTDSSTFVQWLSNWKNAGSTVDVITATQFDRIMKDFITNAANELITDSVTETIRFVTHHVGLTEWISNVRMEQTEKKWDWKCERRMVIKLCEGGTPLCKERQLGERQLRERQLRERKKDN